MKGERLEELGRGSGKGWKGDNKGRRGRGR